MKKQLIICVVFMTVLSCNIFAQNENVIPVQVKEKFPEVTLVNGDGETITLPNAGRNTMLVFIRGKVTPTVWCPICHYQYLELVEAIKKTHLDENYDMDICFVMPYKKDSLQNWINAFPRSLNILNGWKNPENETEATLAWKKYCDAFFSKDYTFDVDNPVLELPVLFDPDQKVSNGLALYKEEWGGTTVPQNIPTIYIIDKMGKVRFKYHSQYTNDRPDAEYLVEIIEKLL